MKYRKTTDEELELSEIGANTVNYHSKEMFKILEIAQDSVVRKY